MKFPLSIACIALLLGTSLHAEDPAISPTPAATPSPSASPSPQNTEAAMDLYLKQHASPQASPAKLNGTQLGLSRDPNRVIFDDTYQFIFMSVLEGLYRDGASDDDVKALLARKEGGGYLNFIYTCPICMPVEGAVVTYQLRPHIDHMKAGWGNYQTDQRTFGFGLPKETSAALLSPKASVRLGAVNTLVAGWISYRMDHSSLTDAQKADLIAQLKKRREQGMRALRGFAGNSNGPNSMKAFAAGYENGDGDECAICNAALQMPLKLKDK